MTRIPGRAVWLLRISSSEVKPSLAGSSAGVRASGFLRLSDLRSFHRVLTAVDTMETLPTAKCAACQPEPLNVQSPLQDRAEGLSSVRSHLKMPVGAFMLTVSREGVCASPWTALCVGEETVDNLTLRRLVKSGQAGWVPVFSFSSGTQSV